MNQTEYEVIILDIDMLSMEKKLLELGAKKEGDFLQRRYVYDFNPIQENKWIRLRTNGEKTELAVKEVISETSIAGAKELELIVSDFEKMNLILQELGYNYRNYQENKRILFNYNDVEITIDTWPMLDTFMEIEGNSEASVKKVIEELNIPSDKVTNKHVTTLYEDNGIDYKSIKELKFK
jgi:adenylate cyclase class 2